MRAIVITSLAALTAVLTAACGSSGDRPTTASSPPNPGKAAFQYTDCMRTHGVSGFPDPQVTTTPGGGGVSIRQMVPASVGATPAFKSAQKACARLMPGPGSPSDRTEQQARKQDLLAFARCLRGHGVSNFPDPGPQGQLRLQTIEAAGVDLQAPAFTAAARRCVGVTHGAITPAMVALAVRGGH